LRRNLFLAVVLVVVMLMLVGCGGGGGGGSNPPGNLNKDVIKGKITGNWAGATNLVVHCYYIDDWGHAQTVATANVNPDGSYQITIPQSAEVIGEYYSLNLWRGSIYAGSGKGLFSYFGTNDIWRWAEDAFSPDIPISGRQFDIEYWSP
jgi:hypothetical protein